MQAYLQPEQIWETLLNILVLFLQKKKNKKMLFNTKNAFDCTLIREGIMT